MWCCLIVYGGVGRSDVGSLLCNMAFGMKGAALAAFGDMPAGFLLLTPSLTDKSEGVKLGESTFRDRLEPLHSPSSQSSNLSCKLSRQLTSPLSSLRTLF